MSRLRFLLVIKIVAGIFKVKVPKPLKEGGLPNASPLHDFHSASTASVSFLIETGWRCPTLGSAAASNLSAQALLSVRAHGPSFCWVYLDPPPLISFTFGHSPGALWLLSSNLLHKLTLLSILQTRASTNA